MTTFDVIVIGLGGMGSAAAFELARRGARVLGLEQFALGHTLGSSHGHTRIIRKAYYEHPDYVPLARRAFGGWYDLEQRAGRHLLTEVPCLSLGPADSPLVAGVRESARRHGLEIETLSPDEIRERFPAFRPGGGFVGVLERAAGLLYVDDCVRALQGEARRLGAELRAGEAVVGWRATARGVGVETAGGNYSAGRLVIAAGPWAGALLARWGAALRVLRQVPLWFHATEAGLFRRDRFPVFVAETPEGYFYGLPALDTRGPKVARHYGAEEQPTPEGVERRVLDADEVPVRAFLRRYLPGADGPRRDGTVCLYTLTPDRHFVLDRHPEHETVALAAGFSGHGFKFAPVVGEVLADLALAGRTDLPIDLFRATRFKTI